MTASVEDLLRRLTVEEKVAQLTTVDFMALATAIGADPADPGKALAERLPELAPHGVGHVQMVGMFSPTDIDAAPAFLAQVQEAATACGRFAIPALIHLEALNGVLYAGAPMYPTGIAQAATWNPRLVERMARLTRERMLALGSRHALSPVLDLARDPRWGRVHETYGEDPDLAAAMGVAFVRGMQGDDLRTGVAACGKHFIGYAASQGGLNMAGASLGPRTLREQYARPFEAVIREAGVATVMNSYSEIDGLPVAADPAVLDGLLRDELGFTGAVVSDYGTIDHLMSRFALTDDPAQAGRLALLAGIDVEFPDPTGFRRLPDLVRAGEVDEAVVDRAVLRVLRVKQRLGLLDHILGDAPSYTPDPQPAAALPRLPPVRPDHEHSRAMAEQSVVLLHNDGVLPVSDPSRRIALVGKPAAEVRIHYGAYTGMSAVELRTVASEAAARRRAGESLKGGPSDARELAAPGFPERFEAMARDLEPHAVSVADAFDALSAAGQADVVHAPFGGPEGCSDEDITEAARAASAADVAVVVVGERTGRVGGVTAGEGYDRQDLRLPGDQERLVEAVAATGTPTVVVLVSGRPLLLDRVMPHAAAVLWAPLLGPFAGAALASVLTGDAEPSGRLPVSFPASVGQIPVFHGSRAGSGYQTPGHEDAPGYCDGPARPLFAFGHGLTYSRFEYGEPRLSAAQLRPGDDVGVTVDVTNAGSRDADEVVQLYARDVLASTVRPLRQLLAFARVRVPAGETVQVRLTAPVNALALLDPSGRLVVEPGEIQLMVGAGSDDIRTRATARIVGETCEVPREGRFLSTWSVTAAEPG
jgi:beta-glucosidase